MTDQPTINDLRFHGPFDLCEHGARRQHPDGLWSRDDWCPGGREPTRQELIAMLGINHSPATIQEALETFVAWGLQNDVPAIEAVAVLCEVAAALGGGT